MADNAAAAAASLDNHRLKSFKNKGRDVEVGGGGVSGSAETPPALTKLPPRAAAGTLLPAGRRVSCAAEGRRRRRRRGSRLEAQAAAAPWARPVSSCAPARPRAPPPQGLSVRRVSESPLCLGPGPDGGPLRRRAPTGASRRLARLRQEWCWDGSEPLSPAG